MTASKFPPSHYIALCLLKILNHWQRFFSLRPLLITQNLFSHHQSTFSSISPNIRTEKIDSCENHICQLGGTWNLEKMWREFDKWKGGARTSVWGERWRLLEDGSGKENTCCSTSTSTTHSHSLLLGLFLWIYGHTLGFHL